jgi:hypothetical protein
LFRIRRCYLVFFKTILPDFGWAVTSSTKAQQSTLNKSHYHKHHIKHTYIACNIIRAFSKRMHRPIKAGRRMWESRAVPIQEGHKNRGQHHGFRFLFNLFCTSSIFMVNCCQCSDITVVLWSEYRLFFIVVVVLFDFFTFFSKLFWRTFKPQYLEVYWSNFV